MTWDTPRVQLVRVAWLERLIWILVALGSTTIAFELSEQKGASDRALAACEAKIEHDALEVRERWVKYKAALTYCWEKCPGSADAPPHEGH